MKNGSPKSGMKPKNIVVVGAGNVLFGDEGLGPKAIERLRKAGLPENVKVYDAGVSLSSILSVCEGCDKMVIVDAVKSGARPGEICRFALEELEGGDQSGLSFRLSLHEMDIPRAIAMERLVARLPSEIIFIGMEPKRVAPGEGLSEEVSAGLDALVDRVIEELDK